MARTASGSGQKLRNARGATQPPVRYKQLRVTCVRILAANVFKEALHEKLAANKPNRCLETRSNICSNKSEESDPNLASIQTNQIE